MERIVAWLVVAVTVVAALALGYRQLKVRNWLKAHEVSLSPEDIAYHRWSIARRLIGLRDASAVGRAHRRHLCL